MSDGAASGNNSHELHEEEIRNIFIQDEISVVALLPGTGNTSTNTLASSQRSNLRAKEVLPWLRLIRLTGVRHFTFCMQFTVNVFNIWRYLLIKNKITSPPTYTHPWID